MQLPRRRLLSCLDGLRARAGKELFPAPGNVVHGRYAVMDDGRRFLIEKPVDEGISEPVTIRANWLDELTQRGPST